MFTIFQIMFMCSNFVRGFQIFVATFKNCSCFEFCSGVSKNVGVFKFCLGDSKKVPIFQKCSRIQKLFCHSKNVLVF